MYTSASNTRKNVSLLAISVHDSGMPSTIDASPNCTQRHCVAGRCVYAGGREYTEPARSIGINGPLRVLARCGPPHLRARAVVLKDRKWQRLLRSVTRALIRRKGTALQPSRRKSVPRTDAPQQFTTDGRPAHDAPPRRHRSARSSTRRWQWRIVAQRRIGGKGRAAPRLLPGTPHATAPSPARRAIEPRSRRSETKRGCTHSAAAGLLLGFGIEERCAAGVSLPEPAFATVNGRCSAVETISENMALNRKSRQRPLTRMRGPREARAGLVSAQANGEAAVAVRVRGSQVFMRVELAHS